MRSRGRSTALLVVAVALNYMAQVPYYLHQYYLPHHQPPSPLGILLLGITLLWFVVGYAGYVSGRRLGYPVLVGFLLAQVLFYGHSIVLGAMTGAGAVAQLTTSSHFLLVIFAVGYLNFAVAAGYLVWLLRSRPIRTA